MVVRWAIDKASCTPPFPLTNIAWDAEPKASKCKLLATPLAHLQCRRNLKRLQLQFRLQAPLKVRSGGADRLERSQAQFAHR